MKRLVLALMLIASAAVAVPSVIAGSAFAAPVGETFSDPALEARARGLQRELRCLVCQGQSIDESNAPLAGDLRHLVRQQIADGRSDGEIRAYLQARYGDFILMQPPVAPYTWALWLAPFLVLAGAGAVAWSAIARARKAAETTDSANISDL
jgi:cytochrome c-type biogenesis protein CcmH